MIGFSSLFQDAYCGKTTVKQSGKKHRVNPLFTTSYPTPQPLPLLPGLTLEPHELIGVLHVRGNGHHLGVAFEEQDGVEQGGTQV